MPIQVFADESGNKGQDRHFVMAGLIGHSEDWAEFSNEWSLCLKKTPAITHFKMSEAASCGGQFYGWSEVERDSKLREFARIINRYAKIVTWSVIDLDAHAEIWAKHLKKPVSDPYFWPFHNTIMAACFTLWDAGWREKFEIIFDEQVIFGPRAKLWYPVVRAIGQHREPEASTILPADPMFKTDDESLPIQAADLYAWCIRRATNDPSYRSFEWLLKELKSVSQTDYSQYYDKERMVAVMSETYKNVRDGLVPSEIVDKYREILGQS